MKDMKGVQREECTKCGADECDSYIFTPPGPCGYCGCPPVKHRKVLPVYQQPEHAQLTREASTTPQLAPPQTAPATPQAAPSQTAPTTPQSAPPQTAPTTQQSVPPQTAPTTPQSAPPQTAPTTPQSAPPQTAPTTPQSAPPQTAPTTPQLAPPQTAPTTPQSTPSQTAPTTLSLTPQTAWADTASTSTGKRKLSFGDGVIEGVERRKKILKTKGIKLHTPEAIATSSGAKKKKKFFENAKYMELVKYRNMRVLNKNELQGVVHEAYIKYASEQELLIAQELCSNEERLKGKLPVGKINAINIKRVSINIERLKKALEMKSQIHTKLKQNWEELSEGGNIMKMEKVRRERTLIESQMTDCCTELKRAKEALRKSTCMSAKEVGGLLTAEVHVEEEAAHISDDEMEAIVAESKFEAELEYQALQD